MIEKDLENLIDQAVSQDFIIHEITDADKKNDSYKALKFTLSFNRVNPQISETVKKLRWICTKSKWSIQCTISPR